ncbi:MAG: hypothetical protein PHE06_12350 [Lachnospiraceae bacterium]|nr:hypothetical protein [Lachnospiraceae bacterium]MDD3796730.1 hypothetical protein [Lachnospiraceae bacterium]
MALLDGCQEGKKTPVLKEVKCPKCGQIIEVFEKEGKTVEETVCDACQYVVNEGTYLSEL